MRLVCSPAGSINKSAPFGLLERFLLVTASAAQHSTSQCVCVCEWVCGLSVRLSYHSDVHQPLARRSRLMYAAHKIQRMNLWLYWLREEHWWSLHPIKYPECFWGNQSSPSLCVSFAYRGAITIVILSRHPSKN